MKNHENLQLIVVTLKSYAKEFYFRFLSRIFSKDISYEIFSLEEGIPENISAPVVLPTHDVVKDKVKELFPISKIIDTKKILSGKNIEQILSLPEQKKILVVHHPESIIYEIINNLHNLGITHINLIPYKKDQELDLSDIDTAISAGMTHLCPSSIENIIDLGGRIPTIETFLELLDALNLNIKYINNFIDIYIQELMIISKKLVNINRIANSLIQEQETILDVIDEGIISVENNIVKTINPTALKMLELKQNDIINTHFENIFNNCTVQKKHISNEDNTNILKINNDKKIVCHKTKVNESHYIFIFKEISKIQVLEQKLRQELSKKGHLAKYTFDDIIGESLAISTAKSKAKEFSENDFTILLLGESGTGKEMFAQAIHLASNRKNGPFLAINFAALPENLIESELFGYEEGAFTGAKKGGKPGIFELAHGGTIFLDEIGDAPLNIQVHLLRVLQEQEIMRVGGSEIIPVNIRVIAATNKNLEDSVKEKNFRNDLYYRLNVLPINIPNLYSRDNDLFIIINEHLKRKYNETKILNEEVKRILLNYNWPGNVRELINVTSYIYLVTKGKNIVEKKDLPSYFLKETVPNEELVNSHYFNLTKSKLEAEGNMDEFIEVLSILYNNKGLCIGRNKIRTLLSETDISLTEYKVKHLLKRLDSLNLISIGTTKQGSKLTPEGLIFIKHLLD
ncbi:Transcriptional regulator containing PAS, AAA-type ATPase, and DNA-binding Fis domains [Dethiosulfatibacter aminovorans DSM 17477]|uniref:Transcriptional regulator containing PAS, AAA-type ATPase, and DNA-binding Fis domains n=1 Tax=Dethiosulfatibacter aminovorans DSM 17477 TaxID=1121476 RepID=A0A1M6MZE3_9FIRM|nr:sigma 54-interacting transcriptional regulator [Dethiosulfatibacter aminovorans]SHJ88762.1 Transcriptional regulator containing PAS, AAA-type ATPase, and DNA-binding Fis domains [Dethiosulfatibacter aminovorans DSM 17477]